MKLMIASDIHGSAYYCEKWLRHIKGSRQTDFFCLAIFFIMDQGMTFRVNMTRKSHFNA